MGGLKVPSSEMISCFSEMVPRGSEQHAHFDENVNLTSVRSLVMFLGLYLYDSFILFGDINTPSDISMLLICFEEKKN